MAINGWRVTKSCNKEVWVRCPLSNKWMRESYLTNRMPSKAYRLRDRLRKNWNETRRGPKQQFN